MTQALGLIEVIGLVTAVEAADAALKAANVQLLGVSKVGSGIMTVQLMGDVGAIGASVEAGAEAARRIGKVRTQHVIARTEESVLTQIILPSTIKGYKVAESVEDTEDGVIPSSRLLEVEGLDESMLEQDTQVEVAPSMEDNRETVVSEDVESTITPVAMVEDIPETEEVEKTVEGEPTLLVANTEDELSKLSIAKLKELLVQQGITISDKKLKSAKKQDLIRMIMDKKTGTKGGA